MTVERWDTRAHHEQEPHWKPPWGTSRYIGYDTECGIPSDATHAVDEGMQQTIRPCRARQVSEHLAVPVEVVGRALADGPSFIAEVEALNSNGKLRPVVARALEPEELTAERDLGDPERPARKRDGLPNSLSLLAGRSS